MIIFWLLNSLLLIHLITPSVLSGFLFLDPATVGLTINQILAIENGADNGVFDTVSQVLATFIAIVFTISLFVIQLSSEKYTPNIKKYFKENLWRNRTFGLGLITILICILFLILDENLIFSKVIIFGLLILNFYFFYMYYNRMVDIINPYKIADLLEKEFNNSVRQHELEEVRNILSTLSDVIIKAIKENDEALTIKYTHTFIGIYYDLQAQKISQKEKIEIETLLFASVFRAFRVAIDNKNSCRKFLIQIFFEAIQNEASKNDFVDENEIDLITTFLFDFNRYAIENDDFELFKTGIHHITTALVSSPRYIQNEIYAKLMTDIPETLVYSRENNEKIFTEINCFNFSLHFLTVREFLSTKILIKVLESYEKNLEKSLETIAHSEEKIGAISKIFDSTRDEFLNRVKRDINSLRSKDKFDFFSNYKQLDLLFISLKMHFVFYRLGAFIIFKGKQERINSAFFLKELWDHTHPDDVDGIILNESPVILDPLWLTYLHFYGGQNVEFWIKTSFGISWDYDDYHGAEDYLYQYYLLAITRCIQRGNSKLDLPLIEGLDSLKSTENYKLNEWYDFTRIFQSESKFLLDHLEKMVCNATRWDFLFNDEADEAFTSTKYWIQAYTKYCEKLHEELIKRIESDPRKIEKFSKIIIEEYRQPRTIDELTEITSFDEGHSAEINFIDIEQTGVIRKEIFFQDDTSHPEHIFKEFGRRLGIKEKLHIMSMIRDNKNVECIKIKDLSSSSIFDEIKKQVHNMVDKGFNPTTIFIPLEIMKNFVIAQLGSSYQKIKIDNVDLKVITSTNYQPFEEIIILDKSTGTWTFKPSLPSGDRINVEISPFQNNTSKMKILVKTTVNYSITRPDAAKIIKFDIT